MSPHLWPARRQRGGTLVEFALVAPLVILLIMAVLELAILFWVNLTLQHAVREGARYAVTGQGGALREQLAVQRIVDQSMGLYQRVQPVLRINRADAPADPAQIAPGTLGAGGELLLLRVDGAWPVASPLLQPWLGTVYRFRVAATMRNEAFE
jgi:Flp pilus assembly protein TadG